MPKIRVEIEYDEPVDDPFWLNPGSLDIILQQSIPNVRWKVTWNPITGPDPSWPVGEPPSIAYANDDYLASIAAEDMAENGTH